MVDPTGRNFFLLWLFVAFVALAAAAVSYFGSGEVNTSALFMAITAIAMFFISRSKSRGPDE